LRRLREGNSPTGKNCDRGGKKKTSQWAGINDSGENGCMPVMVSESGWTSAWGVARWGDATVESETSGFIEGILNIHLSTFPRLLLSQCNRPAVVGMRVEYTVRQHCDTAPGRHGGIE